MHITDYLSVLFHSDLLSSLSREIVTTAIDTIFPPNDSEIVLKRGSRQGKEGELTGEFVHINR